MSFHIDCPFDTPRSEASEQETTFKFKFDDPNKSAIAQDEGPGKLGYSYTAEEAVAECKQKPYMYERVTGACIPYFDIEYGSPAGKDKPTIDEDQLEDNKEEYDKLIISVAKKFGKPEDLYIASSHGKAVSNDGEEYLKLSWHVIVRGIGYYKDGEQVKEALCDKLDAQLKKATEEGKTFELQCDRSVYKAAGKQQMMRTIGSYKAKEGTKRYMLPIYVEGKRIEKKAEQKKLAADPRVFQLFLLQNVEEEKLIECAEKKIKKTKPAQPREEVVVTTNIIEDRGQPAEDVVQLLAAWMSAAHPDSELESTKPVTDDPEYSCLTFSGTTTSNCLICKRDHTGNRNYIVWNAKKRVAYYKCHSQTEDTKEKSKHVKLLVFGSKDSIDNMAELQKALEDNEEGLANLYLAKRGKHVVFTDDKCGYIYCEQKRMWCSFRNKDRVQQDIRDILGPMFKSASKISGGESKTFAAFARRMTGAQLVKDILDIARPRLVDESFETKDWGNHYLFPIRGGRVLNFKTRQVEERLPEHGFTFEADVDYLMNNAETEEGFRAVDKFMRNITGDTQEVKLPGNRSALTKFVQDMLGYCMTGENKARMFFVWQGPGSNGKSILDTLFRKIMGNLSSIANERVFVEKKNESSHDAEIVPLMHSRMVVVDELSKKQVFNQNLIKRWSGFDSITVRDAFGKGRDRKEFQPRSKLVIKTNMIPEWKSGDDNPTDFKAFEDRMCVVPFDVSFVDSVRSAHEMLKDEDLIESIQSEYMSHFFSWCCEGAFRLYENNRRVEIPEIVKAKKKQVLDDRDIIARFAEACVETSAMSELTAANLLKCWLSWEERDKNVTNVQFAKRFGAMFADQRHTKSGKYIYRGLALRRPADESDEE